MLASIGLTLLGLLALPTAVKSSYCNWGLYRDILPLEEGNCNICVGDDCGPYGVGSMKVVCNNDTNSAILYQYYDFYCSNYAITNMTYLDQFECNATEEYCDTYDDTFYLYMYNFDNSSYCSGSYSSIALLSLVELDNECIYDYDSGYYSRIKSNWWNGVSLDIYGNSNCSGMSYYNESVPNGECEMDSSSNYGTNDTGSSTSTYYAFTYKSRPSNSSYNSSSSNSSSGASEYSYGNCNYGLVLNNYPLAEYMCATCEGDGCNDEGSGSGTGEASLYFFCWDEDYGILVEYDTAWCAGNATNYTLIDTVYCGSDDYCGYYDISEMSWVQYDEYDCDGNMDFEALLPLTYYAESCFYNSMYGIYVESYLYGDYGYVAYWEDAGCNGTLYGYSEYYDDLCDNRTYYSFETFSNSSYNNFTYYGLTLESSDFDCNFAAIGNWPLAEGLCSVCTGDDCDGILSAEAVCDGGIGMVYEYSDSDSCDGDPSNYTYSEYYICNTGNSGDDCSDDSLYTLTIQEYYGEECDGTMMDFEATLILSSGNACFGVYDYYDGMYYYVGIESSEDGIFINVYLENDCTGMSYFNESYSNDYCQSYDGNSTLYTFDSYSGNSGGGDDDDEDIANTPYSFKFINALIIASIFALCSVMY